MSYFLALSLLRGQRSYFRLSSMIDRWRMISVAVLLSLTWTSNAYRNATQSDLLQTSFSLADGRPDGCPPCLNCNLDPFQCQQFAACNKYNGKCSCPPGFGAEDCSKPLCGSLGMGKDRGPRTENECQCSEGWEGINCNVCKTDNACDALMPDNTGGVC